MTDRQCSFADLLALFDLARAGLPTDVARVGGRAGIDLARTRAALDRLCRGGLARAEPARLTLAGLALATSLVEVESAPLSLAA